jgi:hypothetical protein
MQKRWNTTSRQRSFFLCNNHHTRDARLEDNVWGAFNKRIVLKIKKLGILNNTIEIRLTAVSSQRITYAFSFPLGIWRRKENKSLPQRLESTPSGTKYTYVAKHVWKWTQKWFQFQLVCLPPGSANHRQSWWLATPPETKTETETETVFQFLALIVGYLQS